jgi:exosortase/archaeosortase family protein
VARAVPIRWSQVNRARVRFALIFASVAAVLLGIYSFPYAEHGFREDLFGWYLAAYARAAGAVIHLTDPAVKVAGPQIIGRTSLVIAKNCDAMDVNLLLIAAMVAFPARWSRRLIGIAAGVALLSVVNVLRIVTLYHLNARAPAAFDFMHGEVWPFAMVALAVGVFAAWSRWSRPLDAGADATA